MNKEIDLEFYFPIVFDLKFEKYPFEQKRIAIEEISDVATLIEFSNKYIASFQIKVRHLLKAESWMIHPPGKWFFLGGLKEDCLNFSVKASIDLNEAKWTYGTGDTQEQVTDKDKLEGLTLSLVPDEFGKKIFGIIQLSQIARPGSLKLREGVIWVNGERIGSTVSAPMNLRESFDYLNEKQYPKLEFLKFPPFYSWLGQNNLIFCDNPANVFQKAINNLSYLNGKPDTITELVYQMMTLEQLYTNSSSGIAEQLHKKIQVFLGPMNSHKREIKKMYDIRSRFLHGDLPLKPFHQEYDVDEFPEFENELLNASSLSVLLIIATLQKMYIENRVSLNFEYTIKR